MRLVKDGHQYTLVSVLGPGGLVGLAPSWDPGVDPSGRGLGCPGGSRWTKPGHPDEKTDE